MNDKNYLNEPGGLIRTPGLELPDPNQAASLSSLLESAFRENGGPGYGSALVNMLRGIRMIGPGSQQVPIPDDTIGLPFVSRPLLNLSDDNVGRNIQLLPLYRPKPNSIQAYLKGLLDPKWGKANDGNIEYLDPYYPWIAPLTNLCKVSEGFPDISLKVGKSSPGFRNEVRQHVDGVLKYNSDFDMRQTYYNPKPNFLPYLFEAWLHYIDGVTIGDEGMEPYPEALLQNYIDYDCRIYHMILNKNMRNIEGIYCNGSCFPSTFPSGAFSTIDRTGDSLRGQGQDELSINFSSTVFRFGNIEVADMFNRTTVFHNPDMHENIRRSKFRRLEFDEYYANSYNFVYPWININEMTLEYWVRK